MPLLTQTQHALLLAVGQSELSRHIYFTGGTLLAHHYLRHRRSLDLDFFSDNLLDDLFVAETIRIPFKAAGVSKVRYVRFPSRWQYFLMIGREEIKFEIAYFPFPNMGRRVRLPEFNLSADSLRDIAVNKVHACFEREASRDVFDLYTIMTRKRWTMRMLLKDVERKFGVVIDLVHLTTRLLESIQRLNEIQLLFIGSAPDPKEMSVFFEKAAHQDLRRKLRS